MYTELFRLDGRTALAAAVLFLVSDAASYVIGSILTIDGGYTIH